MSALFGASKDEFVTSLAALALYDGDAEVTADNISALLAASNNTVAPYWPTLFAGLLGNGRIEKLVFTGGVGSGPAPAAIAPVASGAPAAGAAKEEKKPKEEEVLAAEEAVEVTVKAVRAVVVDADVVEEDVDVKARVTRTSGSLLPSLVVWSRRARSSPLRRSSCSLFLSRNTKLLTTCWALP